MSRIHKEQSLPADRFFRESCRNSISGNKDSGGGGSGCRGQGLGAGRRSITAPSSTDLTQDFQCVLSAPCSPGLMLERGEQRPPGSAAQDRMCVHSQETHHTGSGTSSKQQPLSQRLCYQVCLAVPSSGNFQQRQCQLLVPGMPGDQMNHTPLCEAMSQSAGRDKLLTSYSEEQNFVFTAGALRGIFP